ncbi:MAG: HEAT repeat domain-containing protein [Planctomycetales bacterium]|nr:HEAT repeat domain-containing protein [Planctomycetales bacterium]
MDWNARFITSMVALFGCLAIFVVGIWWSMGDPIELPEPPTSEPAIATGVTARQGGTYLRGAEALRARARIDELEESGRSQERLLDSKNEELDEARRELLRLRADLAAANEFNDILVRAAAQTPAAPAPPAPLGSELLAVEPTAEPTGPANPADPATPSPESESADGDADTDTALQTARQRLADLEAERMIEQIAAADTMRLIGAPAVDGLIRALQSPRADVRRWACNRLGDLGQVAGEAIPYLVLLRSDQDESVRDRASAAIARIQE